MRINKKVNGGKVGEEERMVVSTLRIDNSNKQPVKRKREEQGGGGQGGREDLPDRLREGRGKRRWRAFP